MATVKRSPKPASGRSPGSSRKGRLEAPGEWWEDFFSGAALDLWRAAVSAEQTRAEADFIAGVLELSPRAKVLDVPCGEGRLSRELAARGVRVTGVDITLEFLEEAKAKAAARGLDIRWVHRDMRHLGWQAEFDGACCFGNSFGYFTDEGNASFLVSVGRALKAGARFAVDGSSAAETILPTPHLEKRTEARFGDILFIEENHYNHVQGRLDTAYTFVRGDMSEKKSGSHRIYTYRQMVEMLEAAGFENVQGFGSTDKAPFALGASQLFLVATKKRRPAGRTRKAR